ncbi:MAG TPA: 50S ribosomal protein L4 [Sedimentisphaerales bacterium]|nr:50S ribosomal protein L4 [Sedimentisphaerales bacterium]
MISLSVYNRDGQEVGSLEVDESILGGKVRYALLKQAIVMYDANKRVGTAATKSRGMVAGSRRKLFRQKGTGNARVGNIRTGKRVGGGVTFGKVSRDFGKRMPRKQRRLATDSAVLAKLLDNSVVVVDELGLERPKTKDFVKILGNLQIPGKDSCLVAINDIDANVYKSARNIPRIAVMAVDELNAGDVCNYSKMVFTKEAFMSFLHSRQDKISEN